eukprot:COSAG02_NODE_28393_length_590_cov_1.142566_1_plen_83_part_01
MYAFCGPEPFRYGLREPELELSLYLRDAQSFRETGSARLEELRTRGLEAAARGSGGLRAAAAGATQPHIYQYYAYACACACAC